jgi:hypothetical protein
MGSGAKPFGGQYVLLARSAGATYIELGNLDLSLLGSASNCLH